MTREIKIPTKCHLAILVRFEGNVEKIIKLSSLLLKRK